MPSLALPLLSLSVLTLTLTHASSQPPPQPQVPLHSYSCPSSPPTSCSPTASSADGCCVPSPGGLVLFRQRFEPTMGDEGRWSIDGVEILDCNTLQPPPLPASPSTLRPYSHEQIASFCTTSSIFQSEYTTWESEWAESEVGEGVEEVWERVVSSSLSLSLGQLGSA